MEGQLLKTDFKVENVQQIFTSDELVMIDATANGDKLPKDAASLRVSIAKKTGAKSWPQAICYLFKFGVIKSMSLALLFTLTADLYNPAFDTQRTGRSSRTNYSRQVRREV